MFDHFYIKKGGDFEPTKLQAGDSIILSGDRMHLYFSRTDAKVNEEGIVHCHSSESIWSSEIENGVPEEKRYMGKKIQYQPDFIWMIKDYGLIPDGLVAVGYKFKYDLTAAVLLTPEHAARVKR